MLRQRGAGEAGAPAFRIGVERKLGDDEQSTADCGQIQIHFAVFILENAQAQNPIGELLGGQPPYPSARRPGGRERP